MTYQTGVITSVAGNGTAGYSGDGGSATKASISVSSFMVVDSAGNIYFVDSTCRIRKVNASNGNITTVAGNGTRGYSGDGAQATSAKLNPGSIAIDPSNGDLYISDAGNYRVRKVSATTGIISTVAGNGSQICCGRSMSYGDGGLATSAEFSQPGGITVDLKHNIYIADDGVSNRIRKVDGTTGVISTFIGGNGSGFSGDGGSAANAQISGAPVYLTSDPAGNLYFYDSGNARIRKVLTATGIITTVAGNGTAGTVGDGNPATSAQISPRNLTVDSIGNLYFPEFTTCCQASSYINRVRVVSGNTITGFINPKYLILGVSYAPPGPQSFVQYQSSTMVGTTNTYTRSFQPEEVLSLSAGAKIEGWGAEGKVTGTESSDWVQGSNSSNSITVSKTTTLALKTSGTGDQFYPVDHDDDIIWIWLNPLLIFKVNPEIPNSVQWNGYGYDTSDVPNIDVYGLSVGEIKSGSFNPSVQQEINRAWAAGQVWPAGEGPALTYDDLSNILNADPFSNSSYSLPTELPQTTSDGRFTATAGLSFPYKQAQPENASGVTDIYSTQTVNSTSLGQSTTTSFKQSFGMEEDFAATAFGTSINASLKESSTLSWNNTWQGTLTTSQTQTNNLQIVGPNCPALVAPCDPLYSGPPSFVLYQDNQYGTFMFAPKMD